MYIKLCYSIVDGNKFLEFLVQKIKKCIKILVQLLTTRIGGQLEAVTYVTQKLLNFFILNQKKN